VLVNKASIEISDNLKEHSVVNTRYSKTSYWSADNVSLTNFATWSSIVV